MQSRNDSEIGPHPLPSELRPVLNFAGMNVLVTGATGGIGHALATEFAAHGAHVVATGRDVARGEGLVTDIRDNGGFAEFLPCDLSALEDIQSLINQTTSNGNRVDTLINNAAIAHFGLTTNISGEDFEATFNVNVRAPILLVAAFAPLMAGRGQGAIVNVTSLAADRGLPIMGMYGASKASWPVSPAHGPPNLDHPAFA